jgi:hypothetical protein
MRVQVRPRFPFRSTGLSRKSKVCFGSTSPGQLVQAQAVLALVTGHRYRRLASGPIRTVRLTQVFRHHLVDSALPNRRSGCGPITAELSTIGPADHRLDNSGLRSRLLDSGLSLAVSVASRSHRRPLSRTTTQEATAIRGASASLARPGSTTNSSAGSRRSPILSFSSGRSLSSQPRLKLSRARARPLRRTSSQEAMLTWRNCSRVAAERRPFAGYMTITSAQCRMKKKWR